MRSPDGANGSRECAPDDRLREIRGRNQRFPDCASLHPGYGLLDEAEACSTSIMF
jgi:hypothetical protein